MMLVPAPPSSLAHRQLAGFVVVRCLWRHRIALLYPGCWSLAHHPAASPVSQFLTLFSLRLARRQAVEGLLLVAQHHTEKAEGAR